MERDEAKFPPEPYYPWLVLPWNVKDEDEDDEAKISKIIDIKEKPMNCSKCEYLRESTPGEESMWAECGITEEQLNPFELCYSTGIGKRCPYTKVIT